MNFKKLSALLISGALILGLAGCGGSKIEASVADTDTQSAETSQAVEGVSFKPGTYKATATGMNGDVTVEVTVTEDKIETVAVTEHAETEGIGTIAIEKVPAQIIKTQSIQVDTVSGATLTTDAIIAAVTDGLKQAGVDAASLKPIATSAEAGDKTSEDKEVDVVVVGAGGAGMTAAIEAAKEGKKVVLVEKASMTGGNTTRSTGGMNAAATPNQATMEFKEGSGVEKTLESAKENYATELADLIGTVEKQYADYQAKPEGYYDSPELFMLDTLVGGKNVNDHKLVEVLAKNSAGGIEWLKSIGADLKEVGSLGGASVKRCHKPVNDEGKTVAVGTFIVPVLTKNCEDLGVEILYDTAASEILTEGGAVVGVVASSDTAVYTIKAKAVVIATGGFGANEEMYTSYKPELKGYVTTNAPTIMGDGIKMAEAIGAATVDMEQIQIHPTVEQATSALITEGLRGDGAILVNAEGKRFTDEVGTRDAVSAAEVAQTGGYAYLIVDQAMVDASSVIGGYIKSGFTIQGETYEELAKAIGVDEAAFSETMKTWNESVAAKKDDAFGRTSFANPLDKAPFYAIKIAPGVHHTMGGLKINESAEVLSADGTAIPGLFAAGEVTGGVHGANRLGGNAVADIIVFGRIAGQGASAYAK